MGDWTSQNRTKRDGRNNQEEQEQEKKVTYKTAAELAVKNDHWKCKVEGSYEISYQMNLSSLVALEPTSFIIGFRWDKIFLEWHFVPCTKGQQDGPKILPQD